MTTGMGLDSYSLNLDEINKIIEKESLKPARCIKSRYEDFNWNDEKNVQQTGRNWVVEWKQLDPENGSEIDYTLRSKHFMPSPSREVRNRRGLSYFKNAEAFSVSGYKGRNPEDFEGAICWVQEVTETYRGRSGQQTNVWWKPLKKFLPGQAFSPNTPSSSNSSNDSLNPPTNTANNDLASLIPRATELIIGKNHVDAVKAIRADELLSQDENFLNNVQSGYIFDYLTENNILKVENDLYVKV